MSKLAIVIPAYKILYFPQVLESIANQTCKNFNLYIGVDGSQDDFDSVIKSYSKKISITHNHFTENLGKKDLVAHWERCINLVKSEEWIWLFSDDDIMESTCVENFYNCLIENEDYHLFHFNVLRINENNDIIENCKPFPDVLNSADFLIGRLKGILSSYALEYVFRKEYFMNNKRFENFDLAWGSDDATWIKIARSKGIKTIEDSKVYWRKSRFNISPNRKNKNIILRKLNSQIQFSQWAINIAIRKEIDIDLNILSNLLEFWFVKSLKSSIHFFTFNNIATILKDFYTAIKKQGGYSKKIILLCNYKIYRYIIHLVKERLMNIQFYKIHPEN